MTVNRKSFGSPNFILGKSYKFNSRIPNYNQCEVCQEDFTIVGIGRGICIHAF